MKNALVLAGCILGGLFAMWFVGDWQSRQTLLERRESDLNQAASWGLSAMCNSENQRALWIKKTGSESGGQSSVELGSIIWEITAEDRVPWNVDRIDGDWSGPTRTIQQMLNTDSDDEFFALGDELRKWCDDHWNVLFDYETGVLPLR